MDKVIDFLNDDDAMQRMADRSYIEILENSDYGEETLGKGLDGLIDHLSNSPGSEKCAESPDNINLNRESNPLEGDCVASDGQTASPSRTR